MSMPVLVSVHSQRGAGEQVSMRHLGRQSDGHLRQGSQSSSYSESRQQKEYSISQQISRMRSYSLCRQQSAGGSAEFSAGSGMVVRPLVKGSSQQRIAGRG